MKVRIDDLDHLSEARNKRLAVRVTGGYVATVDFSLTTVG